MYPKEGRKKQIEIYRSMTGAQRLQIGFELYEFAVEICRAGIKNQHPDWNKEEIQAELRRRLKLADDLKDYSSRRLKNTSNPDWTEEEIGAEVRKILKDDTNRFC